MFNNCIIADPGNKSQGAFRTNHQVGQNIQRSFKIQEGVKQITVIVFGLIPPPDAFGKRLAGMPGISRGGQQATFKLKELEGRGIGKTGRRGGTSGDPNAKVGDI